MRAVPLWVLFGAWNLRLAKSQDNSGAGKVTCFQPRLANFNPPNASTILAFINPVIDDACNVLGQPGVGGMSPVFNHTGYSFVKLNIDQVPSNNGECREAFSSILFQCVEDVEGFGGLSSISPALAYLLSNGAYPANPLENDVRTSPLNLSTTTKSTISVSPTSSLPSSTTATTLTTPTSGPAISTTSAVGFPPGSSEGGDSGEDTASLTGVSPTPTSVTTLTTITSGQATTSSLVIPPGGGGSGDTDEDTAIVVGLAITAGLLYLSFSWLGLLATPEAFLALTAVRQASTVIEGVVAQLPVTAATGKLTGAMQVAQLIATAGSVAPNPVTAISLSSILTIALGVAIEVDQEKEQNATKSPSSTTTSTSTSSAPPAGPTEYLVGLNQKWPNIVRDALIDAFPDDGEGELIDLSALGFSVYRTTMSDSLAKFLDEFSPLIPVLTFVSDNEPMDVLDDRDDEDTTAGDDTLTQDSAIDHRSLDKWPTALDERSKKTALGEDTEGINAAVAVKEKRIGSTFPPHVFRQVEQTTMSNAPQHLRFLSEKFGDPNGPTDYHYSKQAGSGVVIYAVDSGLGPIKSTNQPWAEEFKNFQFAGYIGQTIDDKGLLQNCKDRKIPFPDPHWADETGHGTCAASILLGLANGAAYKSELVVVKPAMNNCKATPLAYMRIFAWIVNHVKEGNKKNLAIIHFNTLTSARSLGGLFESLKSVVSNDIVMVAAAGQIPKEILVKHPDSIYIDTWFPQRYGDVSNDDIPIINVGGIGEKDGWKPRPRNCISRNPAVNLISVYGNFYGQCVHFDYNTNSWEERNVKGTSASSPAVVGLIADWLSNPAINDYIENSIRGPSFGAKVRRFLRDMSSFRHGDLLYNAPYNGYRDVPPCAPANVRRQDDGGDSPSCPQPTSSDPDPPTQAPTTNPDPPDETPTNPDPPDETPTNPDPPPTTTPVICPESPPPCEQSSCQGSITNGATACQSQQLQGCTCTPSINTPGYQCPSPTSCDADNCAGTFDPDTGTATCKNDFAGCLCLATAETCGNARSCDANNCSGAFDLNTGIATCQNFFKGCECQPAAATCGAPQTCSEACSGAWDTSNTAVCTKKFKGCECIPPPALCGPRKACSIECAAQWNSLNQAVCTKFFKGCECDPVPSSNLCGPRKTCSAACEPQWNNNNQAVCTKDWRGCECDPPPSLCGPRKTCSAACEPQWNSNNQAVCTKDWRGCECDPPQSFCGVRKTCSAGCNGQWNSNNLAVCTEDWRGCECEPSISLCGPRKTCSVDCVGQWNWDSHTICTKNWRGCECDPPQSLCGPRKTCSTGCNGQWNGANQAECTNLWRGCECNPPESLCGPRKTCSDACNGQWNANKQAECTNSYRGCACNPPPALCGDPKTCSDACQGQWDDNGVARCSQAYRGCKCYAPSSLCGEPQACNLNGCDGTYDANSNIARCRNKWEGCVCKPVATSCGTAKSCDSAACGGKIDNVQTQAATCKNNYIGCPCIASSATPVACGLIQSCTFAGCNGQYTNPGNSLVGTCTAGAHAGCTCWKIPETGTAPNDPTPSNGVIITLLEIKSAVSLIQAWHVFDVAYGQEIDPCTYNPVYLEPTSVPSGSIPGYPESFGSFTSHGISGCYYIGDRYAPGSLTCPGVTPRCQRAANYGRFYYCYDSLGFVKNVEVSSMTCVW